MYGEFLSFRNLDNTRTSNPKIVPHTFALHKINVMTGINYPNWNDPCLLFPHYPPVFSSTYYS